MKKKITLLLVLLVAATLVVTFSASIFAGNEIFPKLLGQISSLNPLHETAQYTIVKDKNRTSGSIQGGSVVIRVEEGREGKDEYAINFDYEIKTIFNTQKGNAKFYLVKEYFTDEFQNNLKTTKHYENEDLKIDYIGTDLDGSDRIKFYDFKDSGSVKDPVLVISSKLGTVPALGALKLDLSGTITFASSMKVILGADLVK